MNDKMTKWFYNDPTGVKMDVERHRQKQFELEQRVLELEHAAASDPENEFVAVALRTYQHLLCQLLESKVNAVSKIGK
jgi:hypothetical protein